MATTFNTTLDIQDPQEGKKPKQDRKQKAKGSKKDEKSRKRDMSEVECFNCGVIGHYANKCPEKKKHADSNTEEEERLGHVTWADASAFSTYQVHSVSDNRIGRTEVLLDNAVDVSIVHPSLLRNIMPAAKEIKINGVRGHQFTVGETGYLDSFFSVYASELTTVNILSFAQNKRELRERMIRTRAYEWVSLCF